jgi:hypothetical protein
MPFKWYVQPFDSLTEMRNEYTNAVFGATRKKAKQFAAEGTEWMKQNAPWKDRTAEERQRAMGTGNLAKSSKPAREGLKVVVRYPEREREDYERELSAAKNEDAMLIDEINLATRNRREAVSTRLTSAIRTEENTRKRSTMRRNMKKTMRQKQYRPIQKAPKGRSAVAALEKKWPGQIDPIVDLHFSYHKDLTYDIWLEVAHGGRYGIISKAVDHWGRKLMAEVKKIATLKQYRDNIGVAEYGESLQTFFDSNNATAAAEDFEAYVANEERTTKKPYNRWSAQRQAQSRKDAKRYRKEKAVRAQRRPEKKAYHERVEASRYRRGL